MNLSHRVQAILDQTQLTPSKLATYIGLKWPKTIYDALSSKSDTFSTQTINAFIKAFPTLNKQWLATGEGQMTTDGLKLNPQSSTIKAGLKDRILQVIEALNYNKYMFTRKCGLSVGTIDRISDRTYESTIERICEALPVINRAWLISGEGEMFVNDAEEQKPEVNTISAINSVVATGNGYAVNYQTQPNECTPTRPHAPLIPQFVKSSPNLDVLHYARENQCPTCPISIEGIHVDLWYSVEDSAMAPNFRVGDALALVADVNSIIPGKVYVIDTKSQGCIFRMFILNSKGDYVGRSTNQELYPDFIIEKTDVIRIFKVAGMFRFNTNL